MDRSVAITEIKQVAGKLGVDLMKVHPNVSHLKDKATETEIYEALYRITKDIEIIKKKVIRLEAADKEQQPDL
jgi:hypothetical protein